MNTSESTQKRIIKEAIGQIFDFGFEHWDCQVETKVSLNDKDEHCISVFVTTKFHELYLKTLMANNTQVSFLPTLPNQPTAERKIGFTTYSDSADNRIIFYLI
jgi:hypothetical protein